MQSQAKTVREYLEELPEEKREVIVSLRKLIKPHLPTGIKEVIQYGMITYVIPLALYPAGYLDDKNTPLSFISIAAQKNHFAIYFMNLYGNEKLDEAFRKAYEITGKKLNMGKSCVRFKKLDDLPLSLIEKAVSKPSIVNYIKQYERARSQSGIRKK